MMSDLNQHLSVPHAVMQLNLTSLPKLPGIESLSFHEIHSDLCELQRLLLPDTDGDSSVNSEDIIDSLYPVKPRKSIRVAEREELLDFEKAEITISQIEHALFTINRIRSNRDIAIAEEERDELEAIWKSYAHRLSKDKALFSEKQSEQELYLRLQQAFLLRSFASARSHGQSLICFRQLLGSLQYFRHMPTQLKPPESANRVKLEDPLGSEIIYVGISTVKTPYGSGLVDDYNPSSRIFRVVLPFARMFCSAASVLLWVRQTNFSLSLRGLLKVCNMSKNSRDLSALKIVRTEFGASDNKSGWINSSPLLGNSNVDDHDSTDLDDSDADEQSSAVQQESASSLPIGEPPLPTTNLGSDNPNIRVSLQQKLSLSEGLFRQGRNALLELCPAALVPTSSLSSLKKIVNLAYSVQSPLLLDLRALDSDDSKIHSGEVAKRSMNAGGRVEDNGRSLEDSGGFVSGQGHLWNGNMPQLRSDIASLRSEAMQLEAQRVSILSDLTAKRSRVMQLSAENAFVRLKMFTRRHYHRTVLSTHNISALNTGTTGQAAVQTNNNAVQSNVGVVNAKGSVASNVVNAATAADASVQGNGRSSRSRHRSGSIGGDDDTEEVALPPPAAPTERLPSRKRTRESIENVGNGIVSNKRR